MRVIAGQARGRQLRAPRGLTTRPALARVRQSIFSRLVVRTDLEGARVLDLFAGSGSLGIEALSRGAAEVVFVDSSAAACATIVRNLDTLAMRDRGRVIPTTVNRGLAQLAAHAARFDLVFVDPPYRDAVTGDVLDELAAMKLLADSAWVVVRQSRRAGSIDDVSGLMQESVATMGDDRVAFYRRTAAAAELNLSAS